MFDIFLKKANLVVLDFREIRLYIIIQSIGKHAPVGDAGSLEGYRCFFVYGAFLRLLRKFIVSSYFIG